MGFAASFQLPCHGVLPTSSMHTPLRRRSSPMSGGKRRQSVQLKLHLLPVRRAQIPVHIPSMAQALTTPHI